MMSSLSISLPVPFSFSNRSKVGYAQPLSQRSRQTVPRTSQRGTWITAIIQEIKPDLQDGEKSKLPIVEAPYAHVIKGGVEHTVPVEGWGALDNSGHLSPFSFKRRKTGTKDIAFDVKFCGVCHTDLHHLRNEWGDSEYPMVPGHEIVGVVTQVGSEVTKFKVGEHIGVGLIVNSCRNCSSCNQKLEQYCRNKFVWTYGDADSDGTRTYGGYSNKMVVNEDYALKLPMSLPLDSSAPLLCAGITVYSPMKHYEMGKGGKNFGVIGLGGLGHMAAKFAKAFGMHVTVISTSPKKENEARQSLGADNFIVSKDEEQMKAASQTLDFIIDTVSAPHPTDPYLDLLKINGKLICLGIPPGQMKVRPDSLIYGRRTLGGSLIGGIAETQEMLNFCAEHKVSCEIEKIPPSYLNEAMERLLKSDVHYRFVIDMGNKT